MEKYNKFTQRMTVLFVIVSMLCSLTAPFAYAQANDEMTYKQFYKRFELRGKTDVSNNACLTVLLTKDGEILHIGETKVQSNGDYKYTFNIVEKYKDIENAVISVKKGNEDVTDTVIDAAIIDEGLIPVPCNAEDNGDSFCLYCDLTELCEATDEFTVIAAQYSENGKLLGTKIFGKNDIIANVSCSYLDIDFEKLSEAPVIRTFVWSSFKKMLPCAYISKTDGLKISFDEKTDLQTVNGYTQLVGDNNYEKYKSAVAELPDEVGVVEPFNISAKNVYYVSPSGNDSGRGTLSDPYETIERAVEEYNSLSLTEREKWTAIYLRDGLYNLTAPIELKKDQNNKGVGKLLISSYKDEKPIISTVNTTTLSSFSLIDEGDSDYSRISEGAKGKVYYCDYSDLGITSMADYGFDGGSDTVAVNINGEQQKIARYPDFSYDYVENVINDGKTDDGLVDERFEIEPVDKTPFSWQDTGMISIFGCLSVTWADTNTKVTFNKDANTISAPAAGTVWNGTNMVYPVGKVCSNSPNIATHFYYYNALEAVNIPGEWCCDDNTRRIYMCLDGISNPSDEWKLITNSSSIFAKSLSDIVINGIEFNEAENPINAQYCNKFVVQNCSFRNIKKTGVDLQFSEYSGVINSKFYKCSSGVSITNASAAYKDLEPQRNFVQNCHFNDISNGAVGLQNEIGAVVSHNTAEKMRGSLVSIFTGSENIVEYNEARASARAGNETSIIYIDGHFESRNNHIRYNYLHDIRPDGDLAAGGCGLSLDDMENHDFIYNNITERMTNSLGANAGDNHIFDSNVIIGCRRLIQLKEDMYSGGLFDKSLLRDLNESKFVGGYLKKELQNCDVWNTRYNEISSELAFYSDSSKKWITQYDDCVDDNTRGNDDPDLKFLKATTGNCVINNVFVDWKQADLSFGTLGYDYLQNTNPEDGIQQYKGMDYNVDYNNNRLESFDITSLDYFNKIGCFFSNSELYKSGSEIEASLPETGETVASGKVGFLWKDCDRANYYKIRISTDPELKTGVKTYTSLTNNASVKIENAGSEKTAYYYQVFGYTEEYGVEEPIASSDINKFYLD